VCGAHDAAQGAHMRAAHTGQMAAAWSQHGASEARKHSPCYQPQRAAIGTPAASETGKRRAQHPDNIIPRLQASPV